MRARLRHILISTLSAAVLCGATAGEGTAESRRVLPGPVEARVVRVIDGDTFLADVHVWPGHTVRVSIRLRGIDAPEMRGACASERAAASRARDKLVLLLGEGPVLVTNVGGGKYYGRVLADVAGPDGGQAAAALLRKGLVRPYSGGRRVSLCASR